MHADAGGGAGAEIRFELASGERGRAGRPLDQPVLRPACPDLAAAVAAGGILEGLHPACRPPAAARPFTPWQAELKGELTHLAGGLLSLRLEGVEIRGDGKPCRVRWGDTWKLREGAPCPLRELFQGEKGWKRRILTHILQQGNARRAAGDCLLDPGWERPARKNLPQWDYCLNQETAEFAYPQCVIAPAAEGTPVFQVPLRPADAEHRDLPDPLQ